MNSKLKRSNLLITILVTLFINMISMTHSQASSDMKKIQKIINHKLNAEKMGIGVAVVVIDGVKTEFHNFGISQLETNNQINKNTLFEIGSITKTFTATALASMVKEGKVKLNDPIQKYLPKGVLSPSKNGKPITLLSLANHSSGLPRLPTNMPMKDQLDPYADYTVEMMYEFLNNHQLEYTVGTKQEYSNLGFGILGHVLTLIDNSTYQEMIEARVLKPLKMKSTFANVPETKQQYLSKGHNSALKETKPWQLETLAGAGALKSSSEDMALYLRDNISRILLNEEFTLTQTLTNIQSEPNIALAWMQNSHKNKKFFMHDGGTGGFRSFIGFDKENKKGIVILTNSEFDMNDVGYHYLDNSLDAIELITPKNIELTTEQLTKLNGKFELVPGFILSITNKDNQLYAQATGQQKLSLTAISSTEFINRAVKAKIVFKVDSQNKAQSLTLFQAGQELPGVKQ